MLIYLDQLERQAAAHGVDLAEACARAGIASTTLARWRKGRASPRAATALAVESKIHEIDAARRSRPEPNADAAA
jgi:transcriptional regulator with XRE-family HTH domain